MPIREKSDERAYLVALQHHEVEMSNAFILVLLHPAKEGRVVDDLADIFIDERFSGSERKCVSVSTLFSVCASLGKTYVVREAPARRPNPFFSVLTISTGAYCRR